MAIKIATTTVITDLAKLQNFTTISGKYSSFYPNAETITTVIDMNKPIMTVELTGATTFTVSNVATGKSAILLLDTGSSGSAPTFPSTFKFAEDTEPTWTGTRYWQVGLTAWDNSTVRVIATGWEGASGGGGGASPSVDLGSTAREFHRTNWWDESTNPHTAGTASMTFSTTGAVNYSFNTPTGTIPGQSFTTQTGSSTWGTAVTGSDYEIKYQFTTAHFGGSVTANPGNNVWLSLGSARTWTVSTSTSGGSSGKITGTVSIRSASTQTVLDTQTQALEVSYYGAGVGNTCLTNNMLVQVQDKGLIRVYDLEVGDMIADDSEEMFTKIIDINKDHPREGYYTVDGWLEITHDHPMLIDNNWVLPNDYEGDKQYHKQDTDTVYIKTTSGTFSVFNEDGSEHIIVSGDYAKGEDI